MREKEEHFKQAIRQDFTTQGFHANPLFLSLATWSGFTIWDQVGFGYEAILMRYKDGWCNYCYKSSDLEKIWATVRERLKEDHNYLEKLFCEYKQKFDTYRPHIEFAVRTDLKACTQEELASLLKNLSWAVVDAIGTAHCFDSIDFLVADELKAEIEQNEREADKIQELFTIATTPSELPFFVFKEESELFEVSKLPKDEREKALDEHMKKFAWFMSSYAGPKKLTKEWFSERMSSLSSPIKNKENVDKEQMLAKFDAYSEQFKLNLSLIDLLFEMQDLRKENVLQAIYALGMALEEMSIRLEIEENDLYQLAAMDLLEMDSLESLKEKKAQLSERRNGVYILMERDGESLVQGALYKTLHEYEQGLKNKGEEIIKGMVVSKGMVSGTVRICQGMDSIEEFQEGEILVASMTRPEFTPAMVKAKAIVTDEGGVACHAANVSRELKIPCIIATKNATSLLKTGDEVEVDAINGYVTKLS